MKRIYSKMTAIGICLFLLSATMSSVFAEFSRSISNNNNLSSSSQEENRTSVISPSFTHINNIVIFLRFPSTLHPDNEFITSDSFDGINDAYNTRNDSLKNYVLKMSYGDLMVNSTFFPKHSNGTYYSVVAPQKIYYYSPPYTGDNTVGYIGSEQKLQRERELIITTLDFVKEQIEETFTADELDTDHDGKIDSIQIFADTREISSHIQWGNLLWPHKSVLGGYSILGKEVYNYNINTTTSSVDSIENTIKSGIITHEFMHILGFEDLYDKTNPNSVPVGNWDLMSAHKSSPQAILQYMQREYCSWGTPIDVIENSGTYTLKPPQYIDKNIDGGADNTPETAYIIKTPIESDEFFVIQCATTELSNTTTNGIIIYRINKNGNPDFNSQPYYMYVFRKNTDDRLNNDNFIYSTEQNCTSIGKPLGTESQLNDSETLYLSDGSNSGIVINNIGSGNNETISFTVTLPAFLPGNGTDADPYLISTANDFEYIHFRPNKNYKLTKDIDFSECTYNFKPIQSFSGVLDGNGKKILNFNLNSDLSEQQYVELALFNSVTSGTIKNITFIEPQILIQGHGSASVIANTFSGVIQNVIIQNGSINCMYNGEGSSSSSLVGSLNGIMENCSSSASVTGYLSGGLIADANAIISNSYFTGTATGTIVGGLIGNFMHVNIEHCFSSGIVNGSSYTGGIVGRIRMTSASRITIHDTYWNINNGGSSSIGYIENRTENLEVTPPTGMIGIGIPSNLSFNSSEPQQLTVTTIPSNTSVTGTWGTTPFYSNVSVSSNGLVSPLYNGESPVTYAIPVGENQMILTTSASVSNLQNPPKTLITKVDSTYAILNGVVDRTTTNNGIYTSLKIINGTAMMPVRFLAETMDLTVTWDDTSQNTIITNPNNGEYITLQIGSTNISKYSQDGTLITTATMPSATTAIEGSTYAPARIIAESFGFQVEYMEYADSEIFVITSNRTPAWTAEEIAAMCADASGKI